MCTKAPATVDFEIESRGHYLNELETCLKRFNGALTSTMDSYRDLLSAFDKMAQVFGNLAGNLSPETKDPIVAMRDGMRDLKDKGGFVTFNSDVHDGTLTVLGPLQVDLKKAQKSLSDLKTKQKDYDGLRYKIEKKEKEYSKKDKALTQSESYNKDIAKRDKAKAAYESKRDSFEGEVAQLKSLSESVLLKSMNNYLHCTAAFSGYLETTMNMYRTDVDAEGKGGAPVREIKLDRIKQEAERRSATRRLQNTSSSQPSNSADATRTQSSPACSNLHRTSDPDTMPGGPTYPAEGADSINNNNNINNNNKNADADMAPMSKVDATSAGKNKNDTSLSRLSGNEASRHPTDYVTASADGEDGHGAVNEGGEGLYPGEMAKNPFSTNS